MAALLTSKMLIAEPAVAALVPLNAPMPAFWVMVTKDGYATVIANAAELQPGNTLELWGLPPGATVPVSLGVVPTTGRAGGNAAAGQRGTAGRIANRGADRAGDLPGADGEGVVDGATAPCFG